MFEHFIFGAHASAQTQLEVDEPFPSPTDCSFKLELDTPAPTSNYNDEASIAKGGINDIVSQLSSHSLRLDEDESPQRSIWKHTLPSPDFDNDMTDFTPEELTYISTGRGKVTLPLSTHSSSVPNLSSTSISNPRNGTVACRRLQRQINTQLQSCTSHIKDISTLVEDMIESSSQCRLIRPSPLPFITEPLELDADEDIQQQPELHEDEGFAEMEEDELEMTLRRASTPSGIRKWNGVRFRASGECVGGPNELAWMGRRKVRCVPRMRRRKPKTVVE